jgi:hypothetical protein
MNCTTRGLKIRTYKNKVCYSSLEEAKHAAEEINKTDKYFLIDFPIQYEKQIIIKKYRQDLRNFINENEIKILAGEKIEFPTVPDFIDLNIIY